MVADLKIQVTMHQHLLPHSPATGDSVAGFVLSDNLSEIANKRKDIISCKPKFQIQSG
jgi:hypothetical protein